MKIKIIIILLCLIATGGVVAVNHLKKDSVSPETSVIQNAFDRMKKRTITLPDYDKSLTVRPGTVLEYSATVHSSVGSYWHAEFDKTAFDFEDTFRYYDPNYEQNPNCGGDAGLKTVYFKAKKKGTFTIRILHDFRGDIERTLNFTITVK